MARLGVRKPTNHSRREPATPFSRVPGSLARRDPPLAAALGLLRHFAPVQPKQTHAEQHKIVAVPLGIGNPSVPVADCGTALAYLMPSSTRSLQARSGRALSTPAAFLRANSEAYEWVVHKTQATDRRKDADAVLHLVASAAHFAATFHPGRFADGTIENAALQIGEDLGRQLTEEGRGLHPIGRTNGRRRVLHVLSHVHAIGGHTRMLHHWVRSDRTSCHSVVLVNQRDTLIPHWLTDAVQRGGGELVVLPARTRLCQKAGWLRQAATRTADLVVLHHGAFDVVPTVAFASRQCPPVAVLNHADHQFWLGSAVSDIAVNLRTAGSKHTAERRFVSSNTVIPIPLSDTLGLSRDDARRALGIPKHQMMLLSVGRAEKYQPCGPYDFVSTAAKILDREQSAHLYVVGESVEGITRFLRCGVPERLHFVGTTDPSLYRAAADIYIESFPFGSQTALLEAALGGLPVVPAYAPLFPLLVANDDALRDVIPNPHDEQEYVERVDRLIRNPEWRTELGESLQKRLLVDHVGEGWLERLAAVYRETDHLTHLPRPIPESPCRMTEADIGLSLWHVVADGKTYTRDYSGDEAGAVLRHSAFVAKDVGDYPEARRRAWRALRHRPYRRASGRLFAIAVLGRPGRLIRKVLLIAAEKRKHRQGHSVKGMVPLRNVLRTEVGDGGEHRDR
jgi:glycosyltransferase involved in cell wall biosynthesis